MRIAVNGEMQDVRDGASVAEIIADLAADPRRVATMVNGRIVPQDERAAHALSDDDRVEVVTFVAGG